MAVVVQTAGVVVAVAFPILHHHRILPGRPGPWRGRLPPEQYVRYWGGSEAIGRYMQARGEAEHELWMFFEHFPHVASDWVMSHPEGIGETLDQLCGAAAALRDHGVVHFDAHLGNVVTDAKAAYLADFGSVGDSSFELSQQELEFLGCHRFYDCGVIIAGSGLPVAMRAQESDEPTRAEVDRRCGITESSSRGEVITALIDGADDIADLLGLTQDYLATLARYRGVNQYMHRFIAQMQARNEKDVPYDDDEVRARLRDAGAPFVD